MRHFFLPPDQVGHPEPLLDEKDAHHIHSVLRLGPGALIQVFDGSGAQYEARIVTVDRRQVRIAVLRRVAADAESPLHVVLAQGYLKDKKMDQLIAPLTELGVARLVPFTSRRSVPLPDEKRSLARRQRWQRITREAVKQCRRSIPMAIDPVLSFQEVLADSQRCDLKLFFWEGDGGMVLKEAAGQSRPGCVWIMIGPEGGFDDAEQAAAAREGFLTMRMGPRILRAETAAVVACALAQYLFGDMGQGLVGK